MVYKNTVEIQSVQDYVENFRCEKKGDDRLFTASVESKSLISILYHASDDLIKLVSGTIFNDLQKKDTVLDAISKIYDNIVAPLIPFYLIPFKGLIKKVVVDYIISALIDFIIAKYDNGSWNVDPKPVDPTPTPATVVPTN